MYNNRSSFGGCGEVAERLKAAVSKTVVGVTSPGVRIPPSPYVMSLIVL
jgi:hypothetical protein